MGRFDLLTQLEKKPQPSPSLTEQEQPANGFTSKPVSQQTRKEADQQTTKPASLQTSLPANQQASKSLKKFSSYATEESLKRLKRIAFDTDRKDYDVLQEAIDLYLAKKQ